MNALSAPPPEPRGKLAVLSAAIGFLFCIPVTGPIAIVLGILALRNRRNQWGGRVLAWIGIAFGMGGVAFASFFSYTNFFMRGPVSAFVDQALTDLATGNQRAFTAKVHPNAGRFVDLRRLQQSLKLNGTPAGIKQFRLLYQQPRHHLGKFAYTFECDVAFSGGTASFSGAVVRQDGRFCFLEFAPEP